MTDDYGILSMRGACVGISNPEDLFLQGTKRSTPGEDGSEPNVESSPGTGIREIGICVCEFAILCLRICFTRPLAAVFQ